MSHTVVLPEAVPPVTPTQFKQTQNQALETDMDPDISKIGTTNATEDFG